jgi:hypothetical protein
VLPDTKIDSSLPFVEPPKATPLDYEDVDLLSKAEEALVDEEPPI